MNENLTPAGKITKVHLHEDGTTTPMSAREIIAAVMSDEVIMGIDEDGQLWADLDGVLTPVIEVEEEAADMMSGVLNDDYLWMIDDKSKFRSWEDDSDLDYRSDFKYPFQKGYTPSQSHLEAGPGTWL